MIKHLHLSPKRILLTLCLSLATNLLATEAFATQKIMNTYNAPDCKACHAGGRYTKAEGKAGLATFLAAQTPTCTAPQVLQNNVCVTPSTPTIPTCTAPQVLQNNVCVTPSTPTIPTCTAPQVLQNNVCVTPSIPTIPTCTAPQVLQNNVCVTPSTACSQQTANFDDDSDDESDDALENESEDDNDDGDDESDNPKKKAKSASSKIVPTLTAPDKVSVHAGETLHLAVTAFDCKDRPITILAAPLPKGAALNNSIDPELHMPKAVLTWTPPLTAEGQALTITLKAVASGDDHQKIASAPLAVIIDVLPPLPVSANAADTLVSSNTISSARYNTSSQKLVLQGKLVWDNNSTAAERLAVIKAETVAITDAATNAALANAKVAKNGAWHVSVALRADLAPCSVDAIVHGKSAIKAVTGLKRCNP
ncbi:MAG: hypothetical protein HOP34_05695 [Methylococcaceae bacterium]|nr:hypothetical protein [Methylococcaceae bacterium]